MTGVRLFLRSEWKWIAWAGVCLAIVVATSAHLVTMEKDCKRRRCRIGQPVMIESECICAEVPQ